MPSKYTEPFRTKDCPISFEWNYPGCGMDEASRIKANCDVVKKYTEYFVSTVKKMHPQDWKEVLTPLNAALVVYDFADDDLNRDASKNGCVYDQAILETLGRLKED